MIFLTKIRDEDKLVSIAIEALSYTEAEAKSLQIKNVVTRSNSGIESISKTGFKEVLLNEESLNNDTLFFKSKIAYAIETGNGKMKTVKVPLLVRAADSVQAFDMLREYTEGYLDSARVFGLEEIDLLDYYDHEKCLELNLQDFRKMVLEGRIRVSFNTDNLRKKEDPDEEEEGEMEEAIDDANPFF